MNDHTILIRFAQKVTHSARWQSALTLLGRIRKRVQGYEVSPHEGHSLCCTDCDYSTPYKEAKPVLQSKGSEDCELFFVLRNI